MIKGNLVGATVVALVAGSVLAGCGADSGSAGKASSGTGPDSSSTTTGSGAPSSSPSKAGSTPTNGGGSAQGKAGEGSSGPGAPSGDRAESARPTKDGRQTAVLNRVPGSGSLACQQAGNKRDLRAGGFVVGPFDTAVKTYGKRQPGFTRTTVRLYWVPLHSKPMSGLSLRLTNLDSGKSRVVTQKQIADAEQWKFYDTQLNLVQAGTWRIQATAGPDRGCVTFTLPRG